MVKIEQKSYKGVVLPVTLLHWVVFVSKMLVLVLNLLVSLHLYTIVIFYSKPE